MPPYLLCLVAIRCHTWGENYDHLMEMLKEAVEGWLEVASEQEQPTSYSK
ncbi:MAG: hypothetical protein QNJ72_12255 [Pleurocapsa sp. MO_226.B13]|nr:hypothetical protein [Pleurocapsa sp. MO_226.B13]